MKISKKIVSILTATALVASLTGCGSMCHSYYSGGKKRCQEKRNAGVDLYEKRNVRDI